MSSQHSQELSDGGHSLQALQSAPVRCQRLKSARASNNTTSAVLLLVLQCYMCTQCWSDFQHTFETKYVGEELPGKFVIGPTSWKMRDPPSADIIQIAWNYMGNNQHACLNQTAPASHAAVAKMLADIEGV